VRAKAGGAVHWLDSTRNGDRSFAALLPPPYRWVLPLRQAGADLEAVPPSAPRVPLSITVLDLDARGGFEARAPVKADLILRGAEASTIQTALAAMSSADAERAIKTYWTQRQDSFEADAASWHYDDVGAVLRLSIVGTAKLDWEGDEEDGRRLSILGAGFSPPAEYRRPKEQDQTAPWLIEYPAYRCWATAIRLPPASSAWKWDYRANPVSLTMGGVTYRRVSDMRDGVVRTVMSKRFDVPEISAAEAQEVNRQLPTFDNKVSRVFQIKADRAPAPHPASAEPPFTERTDWTNPVTPCGESVRP
jgi:hypothetical protein